MISLLRRMRQSSSTLPPPRVFRFSSTSSRGVTSPRVQRLWSGIRTIGGIVLSMLVTGIYTTIAVLFGAAIWNKLAPTARPATPQPALT